MLTLHTFIKQLQLTFVRSYTFVEPWDYKPKELNLQCQMPNWSTIIWEKTTMTLTRTMPNQSAWTSSLILSNCSRHGINQVTFFKKDSTVYFMACQIDGETMETVRDFIYLGSKITAAGDCSHEIKRSLLLERKAVTNLDSILKSRDITLLTKVCLVKVWFFQ